MIARPASPADMAEVLAEQVPEISDNIACRQALGFAGFTDWQVTEHLWIAQFLARRMRAAEIERLYWTQWAWPQAKSWPLRGMRHG